MSSLFALNMHEAEVAAEHQVSLSTVYAWKKKAESDPALIDRLKQERQESSSLLAALERALELGIVNDAEFRAALASPEDLMRYRSKLLRLLLPQIQKAEQLITD